uniref:Uncharacterized protein n=1 Tax=Siphoviridae sp. ctg2r17 TaxID=2825601 RepID=A0A8S5P235_9CAUD|nr:MAG TPA: hypothetical protein [Siphoviridae sp. ctg2r17]
MIYINHEIFLHDINRDYLCWSNLSTMNRLRVDSFLFDVKMRLEILYVQRL